MLGSWGEYHRCSFVPTDYSLVAPVVFKSSVISVTKEEYIAGKSVRKWTWRW